MLGSRIGMGDMANLIEKLQMKYKNVCQQTEIEFANVWP